MSSVEWFQGYPAKRRRVRVGDVDLEILGPANYESLVDDPRVVARFEEDEYLPYWAEFWPASLLLTNEVAKWPAADTFTEPPMVLEIGCGLGVVGLAALQLGYHVIMSDYDDDALAFVLESARHNGLPFPETRFVDWREIYPALCVDRLVAADILYETRSLRPIAEFIRQHLSPTGFALICDANRSTADDFDTVARHCGLAVEVNPVEGEDSESQRMVCGRMFRLTHRE
ncbi:MAG: hypothetical protein ABIG44_03150 [Planctomycetota bacterium]